MWVLPWLLLVAAGCERDRLVATPCRDDSECDKGLLCDNAMCVSAETKACEVITEGNPILQPSPHTATFGDVDSAEVTQVIGLHNIGNCTLTVFETSVTGGAESPFSCDLCGGGFPIDIFPGRHKDVALTFKAPRVDRFKDGLLIVSDDKEYPELQVPLEVNFLGVPDLRVAPNPVEFGYLAVGRAAKKGLQITNNGTGVAPVEIEKVALLPADTADFELSNAPSGTQVLKPVALDKSILKVDLTYHPRTQGKHRATLVLTTPRGELKVPVLGNSEAPAKLSISAESVDLGRVVIGQSNRQPLTFVNQGGVPLKVRFTWGGASLSTDLFAEPKVMSEIAPGDSAELQVAVIATRVGPINGLMIISTNDPSREAITVPVTAEGVLGTGPEVVKLEMTYDNGGDSLLDNDLRDVDLTLEHPFGYVCNKAEPKPTTWGSYGNPSWISFAPKEEPERIILADALQDGTYPVTTSYVQDCAVVPTELLAGLLGITVDALIDALSKGVVDIGGQNIAELLTKVCLQKKPSAVTIKVLVNGETRGEKTVVLNRKGDSQPVLKLVRAAGKFSVE